MLCQIVDEVIHLYRSDGKPLPAPISGCDSTNGLEASTHWAD